MDIAALALQLKAGAMTGAQIKALDNSYLCQNPGQAIQQLRACGYQITVTTHTDGTPKFTIPA